MGYISEESGKDEAYAQSIPVGSGRAQPLWRRDGKELFYRSAGRGITAVSIKPGANFEPGRFPGNCFGSK